MCVQCCKRGAAKSIAYPNCPATLRHQPKFNVCAKLRKASSANCNPRRGRICSPLQSFAAAVRSTSCSVARPNISRTASEPSYGPAEAAVLETCSSPYPSPAAAQTGGIAVVTTQHSKVPCPCLLALLHGAPSPAPAPARLPCPGPWLISEQAASLACTCRALPVMGMGLSGFMPLCGQPAATPRLPSIPARHPSNGGSAFSRKVDGRTKKALCLCVSDATSFMELLHGAWQPAPS
jgi:hypothetical protein